MTDASDPNDATTGIGVPSDNTTLLAVLEDFRREGWDGNLVLTEDGPIRCPSCRQENDPQRWEQGALQRMEGASDPADMMSVMGLTCPECGTRGTVVLHYGPTASPAEAAALLAIEAAGSDDGSPDVGAQTPP